jgi:catechol 2,3-dioxygenase-like lactoylglutathione lyase family enzyme
MLPAGWFPARSGAGRHHRTKGGGRIVYWKLEVVPIPITDVDRAKRFYAEQVGFVVDLDTWIAEGVRLVQFTPPGSACSIHLNTEIAGPAPGSLQGLMLMVSDIDAARAELVERDVEVSPVQHYEGADLVERRGEGWNSFIFFSDPDGNGWVLQESAPATDAPV